MINIGEGWKCLECKHYMIRYDNLKEIDEKEFVYCSLFGDITEIHSGIYECNEYEFFEEK